MGPLPFVTMHKQVKDYWCGPAAMQNALLVLGRRLSQARLAELCGTTDEGTDEHQILETFSVLGYYARAHSTDARAEALAQLEGPQLLCVEDWNHWVTVLARVEPKRFLLVDPHCGVVRSVHWRTLERKWRAAARVQTAAGDRTYYSISVRRNK